MFAYFVFFSFAFSSTAAFISLSLLFPLPSSSLLPLSLTSSLDVQRPLDTTCYFSSSLCRQVATSLAASSSFLLCVKLPPFPCFLLLLLVQKIWSSQNLKLELPAAVKFKYVEGDLILTASKVMTSITVISSEPPLIFLQNEMLQRWFTQNHC